MPRRIANSVLNATTIDIMNTIRANAPASYQESVPEVTKATDIPRVGETIYGYPANANYFSGELMNRIALVDIMSSTFNNPYADLKEGYLEYGESVEEIFVSLAKVREFSYEKAEKRELKRTLPDIRTAFHFMNWRVQYPITIGRDDLKKAFTQPDGLLSLVAKIVGSCHEAANYDEFLLFKYLIIKGVATGKMHPITVDAIDVKDHAKKFRGTSNVLTFMTDQYNREHVQTITPKENQYIFMDAQYNAEFDVDVLASAFNMEKAEFMGKLKLIDSFSTFDNARWAEIRENSDMVEEVTTAELNAMKNIKAVLVDKKWFKVFDELMEFSETKVGSGLYTNYWLNVWKIVDTSPFANAVAFTSGTVTPPDTIQITVTDMGHGSYGTMFNFTADTDGAMFCYKSNFDGEAKEAVEAGAIAISRYGSVVASPDAIDNGVDLCTIMQIELNGTVYANSNDVPVDEIELNDIITFTKQ